VRGSFHCDGQRVMATCLGMNGDHSLHIWDIKTAKQILRSGWSYEWGHTRIATLSNDGSHLIMVMGNKPHAWLHNLESGGVRTILSGKSINFIAADFSHDNTMLALLSDDNNVTIYSTDSGRLIHKIEGLDSTCFDIKFRGTDHVVVARAPSYYKHFVVDVNIEFPTPIVDVIKHIWITCNGTVGSLGHIGNGSEIGLNHMSNAAHQKYLTHLNSPITAFDSNPTDPLSFVAGCADGSVRFFRLEGVDLPVIR